MDQCETTFRTLLGAYHDGELEPQARWELEAHLSVCAACRQELVEHRRLSLIFEQQSPPDVADPRAARAFHEAIDRAADQSLLRLGGTLALVAASLLIVGLAWLWELPGIRTGTARPPGPVNVAVRAHEDWPRIAVTLRPEIRLRTGRGSDVELAEARLADWMLRGLNGNMTNEDR